MTGSRVEILAEEASLIEAIRVYLAQRGVRVDRRCWDDAPLGRADATLLDWPDNPQDGVAYCRALRTRQPCAPLLVLASRRSEEDLVLALEAGADDYLVKPFGLRELEARLGALLRRFHARQAIGNQQRIVVSDTLELVLDRLQRAAYQRGNLLELSRKEFDLLWYFAQQPGRVHSRGTLLSALWERSDQVSARTVDVHVRWLREKIEADPSAPKHLVTIRGVGYRFDP